VAVLFEAAVKRAVGSPFLLAVAQLGPAQTVAAVVGAFASSVGTAKAEAEAKALLGAPLADGLAKNMTRFASEKGVPINSYLLNGLMSASLDLDQGLLAVLSKEQATLQKVHADLRGMSKRGV
jgi:amino acid permease